MIYLLISWNHDTNNQILWFDQPFYADVKYELRKKNGINGPEALE